jgi:hypothetical protein
MLRKRVALRQPLVVAVVAVCRLARPGPNRQLHVAVTRGKRGKARLLLALCMTAFVGGCDSSQFASTPWSHWLLLPLIALAFCAVQVALIAAYTWLVRWATRRAGRGRAAAEALTPIDHLV